jgi:hypothetical protein
MSSLVFVLLLAALAAFALHGAVLLRRVRRHGLGPGRVLRLGGGALNLRYPHFWSCELKGPERARLITHDHDGALMVSWATRPGPPEDPVAALRRHLETSGWRFDDPEIASLNAGPTPGAMLSSTATTGEGDRLNVIVYLFEGSAGRALLEYRCSVLYGQVDAFYLERMARELRLD